MMHEPCPACDGDGELELTGVSTLEHALRTTTRVRALYLACRGALALVHRYRAECCARREAWRCDRRIIGCLEQVRAYRLSIRALRVARSAPGELAWCIACRGSGLADNACEGCGAPVDLATVNRDALDNVDVVVHRDCDTGHAYFERPWVTFASREVGL